MTPSGLLVQLSQTVTAAQTIEQLTRPLLTLLELVTGLESTYLTQVDEDAGIQTVLYARNSRKMEIPEGLSVPWHDTLCKRALDEGRPFTDDALSCWGDSEAASALGIRTYVTTPLLLEDGSLFGTLCAASSEKRPITTEGREALALFGTLIQQHVQREHLLDRLREANRQLQAHSYTDALTGLPNRRFVLEDLHRLFGLAQREGRSVYVAFIDLDGFKLINDRHGHEAGDDFLVEIGRRLQAGVRGHDLIGRLGGDEFVVAGLAPSAGREQDALVEALRDRLEPQLRGRFTLQQQSLDYGGVSLGIICADPDASTPEKALQQADAAMYVHKRARRQHMASVH